MAEPKRRQRPKGGELRDSLRGNPEQSYRRAKRARQLQDRLTEQDVKTAGGALGAGAGAVAADMVGATDPFLSRNEFKPGFYEQNAGMITPQGLYGTASGKTMFESPIVDPDTSMMQNMAEGGSVRGQKNIQVKKKQFRGVF
jgi:hypothetical protein